MKDVTLYEDEAGVLWPYDLSDEHGKPVPAVVGITVAEVEALRQEAERFQRVKRERDEARAQRDAAHAESGQQRRMLDKAIRDRDVARAQRDAAWAEAARRGKRLDKAAHYREALERIAAMTWITPLAGVASQPQHIGPRRSPRRGVKDAARSIMADGQERDGDEVLAALIADPRFANRPPARTTVLNRLADLEHEGFLRRLSRGSYRLASTEARENGALGEGPNLAVHQGDQKPPGEQLAPAHPGHPYNTEGASGVGTGPVLGTG